MKRVFSILGAIIFFLGAAGYYLAFTLTDKQIRNEVAELIQFNSESKNIVNLTLSKQQLLKDVHFTDKKEFVYQGKRYDVFSRHTDGDRIVFHCYQDEKEMSLFSWYQNGLDNHNTDNSSGKISFKPFSPDLIFEFLEWSFTAPVIQLEAHSQITFLVSLVVEIPTPPPNA